MKKRAQRIHAACTPQKSWMDNFYAYIPMFTYHIDDRIQPFNEFNPGLILRYDIPSEKRDRRNTSFGYIAGFYKNSNYTLSPLAGVHLEKKWGRFGLGIVMGAVGYQTDEEPDQTITTLGSIDASTPTPNNTARRGVITTYTRLNDVSLQTNETYLNVRGTGPITIFAAALPKLSFEVIKDKFEINAMGFYVPSHGGIVTSAVTYRLRKPPTRAHGSPNPR
jgi:hypothetical protein